MDPCLPAEVDQSAEILFQIFGGIFAFVAIGMAVYVYIMFYWDPPELRDEDDHP